MSTTTSLAHDTWAKLREHLDAVSMAEMLNALVIDAVANPPLPRQCPRYECRSAHVSAPGVYAWQCWTCGAHGGAATLFAASVAGWLDDEAPDTVHQDITHLLREALGFALIDPLEPRWRALLGHFPAAEDLKLRGIFTGAERHRQVRRWAAWLIAQGMHGDGVVDLLISHNLRKCRPPLDRAELADAINAAAMEAVR